MARFIPYDHLPGGLSPRNGTNDFYLRIRSYLDQSATVLDLGAGRGAWFEAPECKVEKYVRFLRPCVKELVAADVDPVVLQNRSSTRNVVIEGDVIPLPDESVDLIIADFVIEHVKAPETFRDEVNRVLRPGGMFCARTPHSFHYVSIASRLFGGTLQQQMLALAQPNRDAKDVFPTWYRLNTLRSIHRVFHGWRSWSFVYSGDPGYYFGNRLMYGFFCFLHRITPAWFHGTLFVFVQKPVVSDAT